MNESERQLVDLFLDGDLPEAEGAALLQRLEGDEEAVAYLAERSLLLDDLRHAVMRRSLQQWAVAAAAEKMATRPPRWLSWRPLAAAAACLMLLAAGWWLGFGGGEPEGLVIASADGAVRVERGGAVVALEMGAMLRRGDVVATEGGSVLISYPEEETRLELAPATRLEVLSHREGKRLRLLAGSLSAEVAPQPEDAPMRLYTSEAEAVVLGTRFTLNADSAHQELAVQKGAVRVNRATKADSIVVSAEERVRLGAESLELEPLPPVMPPRWRDAQTLALDFETEVAWPVLRRGRVVTAPAGEGHCLAGELTDLVRRRVDQVVLTTSLRPQCVLADDSRLRFRYWTPPGIESIELSLYVFGVDRAFKVLVRPKEHDRWVEWSGTFDEFKSASGAPPARGAQVRSFSIHTSPVGGPLALFIDDVVLEKVSALPPPAR